MFLRDTCDGSDKIYGLITAIPLLVYLEKQETPSGIALFLVFGTLVAIWLAEVYSEYYSKAFADKKNPSKKETKAIFKQEFTVVISSNIILIPFFFELLDLISLSFAYNLSQFLGIGLLFLLGFSLAKHLEKSFVKSVLYGAFSASFGLIIVILKAFIK